MSHYVLPDLDYDYGALEPHIIGPIMELHHDKHHAAYVKNANEAAVRLEEATAAKDDTPLPALERSLAFNLSGHVLHSIFWKNLTPKGGGEPDGELGRAIERDFESFDHFRTRMVAVASGLMGSGWAALTWEPLSERLMVTQIYDHQSNLNQGSVPLLVIDAWEHAYYLQYHDQKAAYFQAVWSLWNWEDIAARYASARGLDLALTPAH
jgi:Fe-Mn family superoxide dismutase